MPNTAHLAFDPKTIADALLVQGRHEQFSGYDPFDGLNSSAFACIGGKRFSLARIAWIQLHKRSPMNLRPIVGVPKRRNPKGIALIILGLLERALRTPSRCDLPEAVELGDWLLTQCVDRTVWKHCAWGYHFDWAARAFYVPKGKPNAITTCYVARALLALGKITGISRFLEAGVDAGFFLDSLYISDSSGTYYAYIPGEPAFVHNANLWSAAVVAEAATYTDDQQMTARALRAIRQSAQMQRPDGAWLYGTRSHHAFIDGFHTGYNLEALDLYQKIAGTSEYSDIIEKGMHYYRNNFFLPDGTVKYYANNPWPLDMHSVAQAVVTLIRVGKTPTDVALVDRILRRAVASLYLPDEQRFMYQKGRWFNNRINYLRWTQAWAFYSLSVYASYLAELSGKAP